MTGLMIVDTDYDYSTETQDQMGRPFNPYNVLMYCFEQLIILLIIISKKVDILFLALYYIINGFFTSHVCPFYKQNTLFWNTFFHFYFGALSFTIYLATLKDSQNSISSLLTILYIPLFYKISSTYCYWQDQKTYFALQEIFNNKSSVNLKQVDRVIRLNIFQELDSAKENDRKEIGIYSLIVQQQQYFQKDEVKNIKTLTNSQYQLKMLTKEIENEINHEQNLKSFLKELIRKISIKKNEESHIVIYLVYLLEIMDCKKSYWVQYSSSCKKKITLKQQQIIVSIHQKFLKQKEVLQKTLAFNNPLDTSYYSVLNFEQRVARVFEIMDQAMKQKVELLVLMKNKQIEASLLLKLVFDLRNLQIKIKNELNQLALINNSNPDLLSLQICYLENLSFSEKDIRLGLNSQSLFNNQNLSQMNAQQIRSRVLKKQKQKMNKIGNQILDEQRQIFDQSSLYDKNSCVIFASIEDGVNLILRKVSNNFLDIFGITPVEVIDKRLDLIMPTSFPIAAKHRQYIASYFKNQDVEKNSMGGKVIFGQSSKGFLVPLIIDIRLNYCYQIKEIGFCAIMKQLTDQNDFILFHSVSLNFMGITSNLQNTLFQKNIFNKKVDVGQFFPFLYNLKNLNNQMQKTSTNGTDWEGNTTQYQQEPHSVTSDNMITTNRIQKDDQLVQKFKQNFEYLLIIQSKKDNQQTNQLTASSSLMKVLNEKEYQFYLMDVIVTTADYRELENLSYIKISKIKYLTPQQNGSVILMHLKDNYELYYQIFSKTSIERIQQDVEYKYKRYSSILDNKQGQNQQQNSQLLSFSNYQTFPQFSPHQLIQSPYMENGLASEKNKQLDNLQEFSLDGNNQKGQKINQEITNFGILLPKKKEIDEIVEEDLSVSSVSAHASSNSSHSKKFDKTQEDQLPSQVNQKENFQETIQSPDLLSLKGVLSQAIKSSDAILSDNYRDTQIMSDLNREIQKINENFNQGSLLNDNNRQQLVFSDNNRNNFQFNDKLELTDVEFKIFPEKESLRQKQMSIYFNTPILSPVSPNISTQDMMRGKLSNSYVQDQINKKESSYIYGQNSILGNTFANPIDNSCSTLALAQQRFFQDKDGLSQHIQNMNETKDTTLKNSNKLKEMKERKKQQLIDQQIENSSTKSRESSSSTKRVLISLIKTESQILAIKIINVVGLIAFITLASVTLQQYYSFMNTITTTQDNLTVQNWPSEVQVVINRSTKNLNLIQLERQNNFTFASKNDQQSFDDEFLNRLTNSFDEFNELVSYMETSTDGLMLFNEVAAYQSYFYLNIYYNPKNMTSVSSRRVEYYNELRNCSLLYSIIIMNQYINRQARNAGARLQEFLVLANLPPIIQGIRDIQSFFLEYQGQQDISVQSQLASLITIILLISALCLFTVLPLYGLIQGKKDTIINLFCTFPVNHLHQLIIKIRSSYYQNKSMMAHIKQIPQEIQLLSNKSSTDQTNFKKQTLSQSTKLPRFNIQLLIVLLVAYLLLSIYPIVNKVLIQNYIDKQKANLEILCNYYYQIQQNKLNTFFSFFFKESLNKVRSFVLESSAMTAFGVMMKIYPNVKAVKLESYISDIRILMSKTKSILEELNFISNQAEVSGRYQQEDFDRFFFPLFENDLCGIVGNNTQFILNSTKFQPDFCTTIENGFLQKGLKLSIKRFTNYVQDLYQILEITDDKQLSVAANGLFQWMDLRDYAYFIDYLEETLNILKYFLLNNSKEYYHHLQSIQLIIIVYQIIIMAIIFGVGWYSFSISLTRSITQTKQFLQVLNIYDLLDNNYILTFVKNNHRL